MSWQILAAINVIGSSAYLLFAHNGLKKGSYSPTAFAIGVSFATGLSAFVYAILLGSPDFSFNTLPIVNLLISLGANTIQFLLTAKALSMIEASTFSILINVRTIFMVVFAVMFLDESITLGLLAGSVLVLAGATIVHMEKGQKFRLRKGELYTLIAALFFAIPFTNDAFLLRNGYDVPSYLTFAFAAPAFLLAFIYPKDLKQLYTTPAVNLLKYILPTGAILATAVVTLFIAFQKNSDSAVLAAIAQSSAVFTVIGAAIFLGERNHLLRKSIATALAFAGLIILAL